VCVCVSLQSISSCCCSSREMERERFGSCNYKMLIRCKSSVFGRRDYLSALCVLRSVQKGKARRKKRAAGKEGFPRGLIDDFGWDEVYRCYASELSGELGKLGDGIWVRSSWVVAPVIAGASGS
jgi:hypothetical protein